MLEKSYITLELPAVLEMLAAQAESELGKAAARELQPSANAEEVRRRLAETSDAARLMTLRGSPSFSGARDIRPALERARLGGALNTRELLDIAGLARCARLCKAYLAEEKSEKTSIDSLFHALRANKYLEERIYTAIARCGRPPHGPGRPSIRFSPLHPTPKHCRSRSSPCVLIAMSCRSARITRVRCRGWCTISPLRE